MANQKHQPAIGDENGQLSSHDQKASESRSPGEGESGLTRRELIKLAASAVIVAPLIGQGQSHGGTNLTNNALARAAQAKAPLFFTREEFALADELTELIIPADDHSPGARAAEVAGYIDRRLAESLEEEPKRLWREGLKLIDSISKEMSGRAFLESTPEQRINLLTRISQNEMSPTKPEEKFFRELKVSTARAYYTTKIGIHTEMEYKGNVSIKEFVGYDAN